MSSESAADGQSAAQTSARRDAYRAAVKRAATAAEGLLAVAAEITADLDGLPLFVRAIASRALQSRSGKSVAEWRALAERLRDRLKASADAADGTAAEVATPDAVLGGDCGLERSLADLDACLAAAPAQATLFSQDAALLSLVNEKTTRQRAAIADLRAALANLGRI